MKKCANSQCNNQINDGAELYCQEHQGVMVGNGTPNIHEASQGSPELVDFGHALGFIKEGFKIARKGWNGTGMFAVYSPGADSIENWFSPAMKAHTIKIGHSYSLRPALLLKTAQEDVAYWTPSISDILAEDWYIVR